MAYVLADRVLETSTTQGTGTINLAGATTGYQSFVDGIGDGNTCSYTIKDGTNWETGIGTVTAGSPDTLSRDTILASSNSDAAVDWGTGTRDVYVAPLAGDVLSKRRDETVTGDNTFTGDNIFQGVVDVTNVNAEGSGGGHLRTNGGTNCLSWGSGGSANLTAGGNLSMDTTHKIVNCADPTSAQDVATKNYVDGLSGVQLLHIQDQKPQGTDGGSGSVGTNTRDLNTVITNTISGASLSSNQITLPAGTYIFNARGSVFAGGSHQMYLYDTTGMATLALGVVTITRSSTPTGNLGFVGGQFTLSVESVIELRHYLAIAISAWGLAGNFTTEVYSDIIIEKIG